MTTLVRLARADAAHTGRRIRLAIDQDTRQLDVLWEADPLTKPNEFTPYRQRAWAHHLPNDLIWVRRMELTGPSAFQLLGVEDTQMRDEREAADAAAPITFLPDGSSDSARIELIARLRGEEELPDLDDPEAVIAVIEVDGMNGLIKTSFQTLEEIEEGQDEDNTPKNADGTPAEPCEDCDA